MLENDDRAGHSLRTLLFAHALLFGLIALACYLSPETAFGDSAWLPLPLPRLAVLLLGAALTTVVIVLLGSALSGNLPQMTLALLAALALDVQVPILAFSQPASIEYLHSELGIPWFVVPLTFLIMVGVTVHAYLRHRRTFGTRL